MSSTRQRIAQVPAVDHTTYQKQVDCTYFLLMISLICMFCSSVTDINNGSPKKFCTQVCLWVLSLSTTEYPYLPRRDLERISKVLEYGWTRLLRALPDKARQKMLVSGSNFEALHLSETADDIGLQVSGALFKLKTAFRPNLRYLFPLIFPLCFFGAFRRHIGSGLSCQVLQ